jgi:thiol-disulfide isomerase/thioredoxin
MRVRQGLLAVLLALAAAALGLVVSVALYGPGPLLSSPLGQALIRPWLSVPPGLHVIEQGEAVSPFTLPGLTGPAMPLPVSGRPTLITYWASWCGPCREELPLFSAYAREHGPSGVRVVAVALDDVGDAQAFLREQPLGFPSLVEAPGERDSSVRLGNLRNVLPYSVLIGADGRLRKRQSGAFRSGQDLQNWAASP